MKKVTEEDLWSGTWFPLKIYRLDYNWQIDWKFIGDKRFTEPFYQDTMGRVSAQINQRVTTPLEVLVDTRISLPETVGATAFIFHVSRCGSTLLTQMLSRIPENIVISEPPVIDQLIRSELPEKRKRQYLKNLILLLCKKRFEEERHAFIKFDAWHLLYLDEIRMLFPDVPLLILYRNPEEVLLSHAQRRGQHMIPGFFSQTVIPMEEVDFVNLDGYAAKVLQIYFEAILQKCSRQVISLLNYNGFPGGVWPLLSMQMQLSWSVSKIKKMEARVRYHSKDKSHIFSGDNRNMEVFITPKNLTTLNSLYKELETYNREGCG